MLPLAGVVKVWLRRSPLTLAPLPRSLPSPSGRESMVAAFVLAIKEDEDNNLGVVRLGVQNTDDTALVVEWLVKSPKAAAALEAGVLPPVAL